MEATGNKIRGEIINARYGPEKTPTSTFFVNVEPSVNNKNVKNIKYIFNQSVKIEDPHKANTIVQCHRCQQYGHSKNNCMRPFRCVKCSEGHKTSECSKKDRNSPAKCALCSHDHPANYKGCEVYQQILSRRKKPNVNNLPKHSLSNLTPEIIPTVVPVISTTTSRTPLLKLPASSTVSYSEVVKNPTENPQISGAVEIMILKQSEKLDILIQQISSLVSLITTLIAKLSP